MWRVIESSCLYGQRTLGVSLPCLSVDLNRGFALLRVGSGHLLLVPTVPIRGIESSELSASTAPNYLQFAWESRVLLDRVGGEVLSRDRIGLAINSPMGRTQDQLHIHIGCLRPEVQTELRRFETAPVGEWSTTGARLRGHQYRVLRLERDSLDGVNPFQLLAEGVAAARQEMVAQTLVVVGAVFAGGRDGFYLLNDSIWGRDRATGEELLDYRCK